MKTTGAAPSRHASHETDWSPSFEDLKHYPHFDAPIRLSEIRKIVNDPELVAKNSFFPLIQYKKRWQPFRTPKGKSKPKPKSRKIRYASRRDAYIYARYRRILSPLYEKLLSDRKISDVPIAYRKISDSNGAGKCNIDFAKDAFTYILDCESCFVITLDISQFFESLDHERIYRLWAKLIGSDCLPKDHAAVFKSITDYRWVDRIEAYKRLGFFGNRLSKNGKYAPGFLVPFDEMPKQLCKPAEFREKIAGSGNFSSIIRKHADPYGIPQGTPISDLIANLYMIDFDQHIKEVASQFGGKAYRYSDDIMLILQIDEVDKANKIENDIRDIISKFGSHLLIKEEKSSIHHFKRDTGGNLYFEHVRGSGKNGLEYLGFRFDGQKVYLRDSTISNLKRKLTFSAHVRSAAHRKRYSTKSVQELIDLFNFDHFFQTFARVENFDSTLSVRNWTFWTYARRATVAFGALGSPIIRQLRHLKPDGQRLVEAALGKP